MVLIFITLIVLITAAVYGAMTYKHLCNKNKEINYCKFSHRGDDYEYDPNYGDFDYTQVLVNESVDFIVIIIAVGLCAIWWVSRPIDVIIVKSSTCEGCSNVIVSDTRLAIPVVSIIGDTYTQCCKM